MRPLAFALLAAASTSLAQPPAKPEARPATSPLTVAVVAALNDQTAQRQVAALAAWVKATLGRDTKEKVFNDYEQAALAIGKGEADLAILGPLAVLRLDPKAKSSLLLRTVRRGHATNRAVLFAKNGSPWKSLEALRKARGLKAGWVDPSSATGYVVPRAQLLAAGLDPAELFVSQDFAGTHDAVCTGVLSGRFDLGATFANDPPPMAAKPNGCDGSLGPKAATLTLIASSAELPNDALVAGAALSKGEADQLVAAARKLASSEAGKQTLAAAFLAEGVADVSAADYDPIRRALDTFKR